MGEEAVTRPRHGMYATIASDIAAKAKRADIAAERAKGKRKYTNKLRIRDASSSDEKVQVMTDIVMEMINDSKTT